MMSINDCPKTLPVCHCIIRHATTDAERKQAAEALDYGTMVAIAALSPCPSQTK